MCTRLARLGLSLIPVKERERVSGKVSNERFVNSCLANSPTLFNKQMLQIKPSGSGDKNVSRPFVLGERPGKNPDKATLETAKLVENVLCLQQIPNLLVELLCCACNM